MERYGWEPDKKNKTWQIDCGLVAKVSRILKPVLPHKARLLAVMNSLDVKTIMGGTQIFQEFNGVSSKWKTFSAVRADDFWQGGG